MANNKIFFDNMNSVSALAFSNFVNVIEQIYIENDTHRKTNKELNLALENAQKRREIDDTVSLVEELKAINAEKARHESVMKPLNEEKASIMAWVTKEFVELYRKGIAFDGNVEDYKTAIKDMLMSFGVTTNGKSANKALNHFADYVVTHIGAKKASFKKYTEDGLMMSPYTRNQYAELLMRTIVDYVRLSGYGFVDDKVVKLENSDAE
jgi:hypothetical protein